MENYTFAESALLFNSYLENSHISVPRDYELINPFNGNQKSLVDAVTNAFYQKYYSDTNPRRLILGSSPARRGSAITGVPFEDAEHLQQVTGFSFDHYVVSKQSSGFLGEVIKEYGGYDQFYKEFYMNFVCPIGIVRKNKNGNFVNCNFYESKKLTQSLTPFILDSLQHLAMLGLDTSICYCIGSGENYSFLLRANIKYHLFKEIIPLEHPRYIMQYRSKDKAYFKEKYLKAFTSTQVTLK